MTLPNVPFIQFNIAFTLINIIILLTFLSAKKTKEIKYLILLIIFVCIYSIGSLFMRLQLWPSYKFWYYLSIVGLFMLPFLNYLQSSYLVKKTNKKTLIIFFIACVADIILQAFNVFLSAPEVVTSAEGIITFKYDFTFALVIYYIIPAIIYVTIVKCLIQSLKDASTTEYKGIKILIFGYCLLGSSLILQIVPGNLFPTDQLGLIVYVIITVCSTYYFNKFYPALLVSRTVIYLMCLGIFVLFSTYAIKPIDSLLTQMFNISGADLVPYVAVIESVAIITFYLLIKKFVDYVFIKDEQRNKLRLNKFSNEIANTVKLDETLSLIGKLLIEEVELNQVIILLPSDKGYSSVYSYVPENCTLSLDCPLIIDKKISTCKFSDNKDRVKEMSSLIETDRLFFEKHTHSTLTKVISGDEVIAIILTSTDNKNDPYSYLNLSFIEMSAGISSLAIKRATLLNQYEIEKIKAIEANKAKNVFLANMSHEIRTPLNAIVGMNDLISRESTNQEILGYTKNIKNSSEDLITLVNNVLDFAKYEDGSVEFINEEYNFYKLIEDVILMMKPRATQKGLTLTVNIPQDFPSVLYGGKDKIKQVLINIVSNAVKYTNKGSILVNIGYSKVSETEIKLVIHVKDTGIGIKESEINNIFNPFNKVDKSDNKTIAGTGLGLWLSKKIVELMKGSIEVESVYGEGTVFKIAIIQEVKDSKPIKDLINKPEENNVQKEFLAPTATTLIVDDNALNVKILKRLLEKFGVQIDTAYSGKECLSLTKLKKYDIVFMDIMMPEMDGVETFHNMKKDEENKNLDTIVIVVTANAVSGAEELYLKEGFDAYTSKPVSFSIISNILDKYLPKDKINYK